jgi:flavin reductase (DIM6/NTAB) family NADH-FMN oxidoreductase RutF
MTVAKADTEFPVQRKDYGDSKSISWTTADNNLPFELSQCQDDIFRAITFPSPLAWISVNDTTVSLLDGYNAICYSPPTLMLSSSALPAEVWTELQNTQRCSLSAVTARESKDIVVKAAASPRRAFHFDELDHLAHVKHKADYPPVVQNSPIHMYCTLCEVIALHDDAQIKNNKDCMILLTVETLVVDGSVLSPATEEMTSSRPNVTAKIDAELIRPWVGLGNAKVSLLSKIVEMGRPRQDEEGEWKSGELIPVASSVAVSNGDGRVTDVENTPTTNFDSVEWSFRTDGRECSLGYNPVTALIMPRPIGWISTFRQQGRVPHLAPYSFFAAVGHNMIAFSGHRPGQNNRKDAQQNAEDMGCFAYNLVTEELAVAMNYSAAPLPAEESEFALAGLEHVPASTIDAPLVARSKIQVECTYVKTVDVPETSFSIVIGKVQAVHIHKACITDDGDLNLQKLRPITRLGYNEYGLL